jgi:hypothetical protein
LYLLITYKSQLQVTVALSLIHALFSPLEHVLSLLSLLCLHQSLSGDGSQQCLLLPCLPPGDYLTSQSKNYVTTDDQLASLSWNKAPIWGLRPDLYYCLTVAGLLMWVDLSEERTGLLFARVTVSSTKSVVIMYDLYFTCY